MEVSLIETKIPEWIVYIFVFLALFIVIYHCYYIFKVITAKCQVCSEKIKGQWGRKIIFIYTPWRKLWFTCGDCQKKKKKKRKEVFKFHFWTSFLIIMSINVLLIIFVERWRYYFLFWDYSIFSWLLCLVFCLIYAFCRVAGIRRGAGISLRLRPPNK